VLTLLALGGGSSWFRGSLDIQQSVDGLVLTQGPSTFVKIVTFAWPLALLLGAWLCYNVWFVARTTTFTCDRGTGKCAIDGETAAMPALADITGAELEKTHRNGQGDFYWVKLTLKEGRNKYVSHDGAQRNDVVAQYRATVEAIQGFLSDTSKQELETSFMYRSSTWEKVYAGFTTGGGLVLMLFLLVMFNTRTFTLERGKLTMSDSRPLFGTKSEEITADKIAAVVDRKDDGRVIELKLSDGKTVTILSGDDQAADQVVKQAHELLGK
jgi:hypothetical protein